MKLYPRQRPDVTWISAGLFTAVLLATAGSAKSQSARGGDDLTAFVGDWRGQSTCVVKQSACRDEDSLYHFVQELQKPGWLSLKADKIVEGRPVTMGTSDCSLDRHTLNCALPSGTLHLMVDGDALTGTMRLSDGTLWRNLTLHKVH